MHEWDVKSKGGLLETYFEIHIVISQKYLKNWHPPLLDFSYIPPPKPWIRAWVS